MLSILIVLGYILFVLVLIAGVLGTLVGLPGTIIILVDGLVVAILTHWQRPTWPMFLVLMAISLIAETTDNLLSAAGTRYGGGSGRTGLMAMVGGIGGALVGSWLSPIVGSIGALGGVLGFIVGVLIVPLSLALVGGYSAAYWYERRQGRSSAEAARAGKGALIGRLLGTLSKAMLAVIMASMLLYAVFHHV